MTKRATFTQAELDRALKVADRHGKGVEVIHGVIRIVEGPLKASLVSPEGDDEWEMDKAFGCDT